MKFTPLLFAVMGGTRAMEKSVSGQAVATKAIPLRQSAVRSAWKYLKEDVFAPLSADYKACLASERYYDPQSTKSPFQTIQTCFSRTAEKIGLTPLWSCFSLPQKEFSVNAFMRLHECFHAITKNGASTQPLTNPRDVIRLGAK